VKLVAVLSDSVQPPSTVETESGGTGWRGISGVREAMSYSSRRPGACFARRSRRGDQAVRVHEAEVLRPDHLQRRLDGWPIAPGEVDQVRPPDARSTVNVRRSASSGWKSCERMHSKMGSTMREA
jgi:hypothetical protein